MQLRFHNSWLKLVLVIEAFPSVAPRASGRELAVDGISQRKTVPIEVDDLVFEIGPDAALVQEAFQAIPLDDSYAATPEYLANSFLRATGASPSEYRKQFVLRHGP